MAGAEPDHVPTWPGKMGLASAYPVVRDDALKRLTRTMNETEIVIFRDYDLRCGARTADPGMFASPLVVSLRTWPSRPRVRPKERPAHSVAGSRQQIGQSNFRIAGVTRS